jgi:hypothetical protein
MEKREFFSFQDIFGLAFMTGKRIQASASAAYE